MSSALSSFHRDPDLMQIRVPEERGREQRYMSRETVSSLFAACINAAKSRLKFPCSYDLGRAITRLYPNRDFRELLFQSRIRIPMTMAKEEPSTQADIALFKQLSNPEVYGCCDVAPEQIGPAVKRLGVDEERLRAGLYWGTGTEWDEMPIEKSLIVFSLYIDRNRHSFGSIR